NFVHRRFFLCRSDASHEEAVATLRGDGATKNASAVHAWSGRTPQIIFAFPGQGAQQAGMGRELYAAEPAFREAVDECCALLEPLLGLDLRDVLYPERKCGTATDSDLAIANERIMQTWLTQPAMFVTEYALAKLWMSWGVQPDAMVGHSLGEYVAACLS